MISVALRATACENEALTVSCAGQDVMRIINAHYGRLENDICLNGIDPITTSECLFTAARDVVVDRYVANVVPELR